MLMERQVFVFVVLIWMPLTLSSPASGPPPGLDCQQAADAFLSLPGKRTLATLARVDRAGCWSVIGSSNASLDRLDHWAEEGNRWAAQYLAKHLNQLDGGNLEDALVALGQFSDHDMESLLLFAKKGLLSKQELTDALTMLPLSLSDNPRAQLDLLSARKGKVIHVSRKNLWEQREQSLGAIDEFEAEIRSRDPGTGP
jgi:hypothetical protein